jgi:hypothetical protein
LRAWLRHHDTTACPAAACATLPCISIAEAPPYHHLQELANNWEEKEIRDNKAYLAMEEEEKEQSRGRGNLAGGWVEKHTRLLVGAPAVLEGSALAVNQPKPSNYHFNVKNTHHHKYGCTFIL